MRINYLFIIFILLNCNKEDINNKSIKFTNSEVEILQLDNISPSNKRFILLLNINTDCSSCIQSIIDWQVYINKLPLCNNSFILLMLGHGKYEDRFNFLIDKYLNQIKISKVFYEKNIFNSDLVIIDKEKMQILYRYNNSLSDRDEHNRLLVNLRDLCSSL